tara:strand:- start:939 stop:1760 length:822 start_codon:yes stop_codon:yes gene_type:complete
MVSMSEFLSGFSHAGEPVIQSGSIDPGRRREGLDPIGTFGLGGGSDGIGSILQALMGQLGQGFHGGTIPQSVLSQLSPEQLDTILSHAEGNPNSPFGMQNGQLTLDPSDFKFGGPEVFARLLQTGEMDGGFLSDASQNAQFAGETAGVMGLLGDQNRDRRRAAASTNLNPIFAERQEINAGYDTLSGILGRRNELGGELAERQFGAQEAFANMLAETDASEKMFKVNTQSALAGAQMGAEGAIAGGKAAGKGAEKGGLYGAIGTGLGLAIGGI